MVAARFNVLDNKFWDGADRCEDKVSARFLF